MAQAFDPAAIMAAQQSKSRARGLNVRCPVCGAGVLKFCAMPGQSTDQEFVGSHVERIALANDPFVDAPTFTEDEAREAFTVGHKAMHRAVKSIGG